MEKVNWYENAFYYNRKGHPVDVRRSFPNGRMLFTRTAYTFTDKPRTVTYELRSSDRVDSVKVSNVYSGVNDALLYTDISYNGGESHRVSSFGYDLLGRPSSKTLPGNAGTVAYSYNVRGWLTGISDKCYSEDIYYNSGNGTPLYNGNISSIIWRDSTQTASRGYKFTYDQMNRLTDAVYGEGSSLSDNTDRYSERGMTYTKNGALTRLLRYGRRNTDDFGLIDSLTITLDGNRVHSVEDGAGRLVYENSFDFKHTPPKPYESPYVNRGSTYRYDGNGRLNYDPDKRVRFSYDLTGNPKSFECGSVLEYVYSSTGEKLCQLYNLLIFFEKPAISGTDTGPVNTTGTLQSILRETGYSNISAHLRYDRDKKLSHQYCTDFNGPFIISRGILDKFLFDGGYCTFKDGQASFHYYLQDHLGNNRAVVSEDGTVEQTTEYYPFGGIYGDVSTNSGLQPYKYNGKEFDHYLGLDLYDYGARLYDPALVVWTGVDPLAEKYGDVSPYAYCHNNPVNRIDYKGLYDFENICGYTDYPVIAVFQSNRDKTLEYDYQIAKEMGMPIFVVDNIGDFKDALDDLALKGSTFQTIALNSHGSYGKFNIGDDTIDMTTDLSSLREKLEGRTVFVGACNVGDSYGCFMVEGLAEQTSSTVVAACHKISAGYRYDGGDGLNYYEGEFPYIMLPSVLKGNKYILSESGSESKSVRNVTIDKRAGISWEGYYFDNYGIFNNKFRWAY